MTYTKISPLGPRRGPGTFDGIFTKKYTTMEEAEAADDMVVIDFVIDEQGVKYFAAYHTKHREDKRYCRLQIQHFPCGIDVCDDYAALDLANKIMIHYGYVKEEKDDDPRRN